MPNGRCRLHGGLSPGGIASGTFKHGRYSKFLPANLVQRYREAVADPEVLSIREDIGLLDTRLGTVLERVVAGENPNIWPALQTAWRAMLAAQAKDAVKYLEAQALVESLIETGFNEYAAWSEIYGLLDIRRKLVESERKRLVEMQQMITSERAMLLISSFVEIIRRHVEDRAQLTAISNDLRRLLDRSGDSGA